jgi:hypothetical protein
MAAHFALDSMTGQPSNMRCAVANRDIWVTGNRRIMLRQPLNPHSHSIVPGGLLVMSYTTLFTPFTSLMIRVAVSPKNFMSKA